MLHFLPARRLLLQDSGHSYHFLSPSTGLTLYKRQFGCFGGIGRGRLCNRQSVCKARQGYVCLNARFHTDEIADLQFSDTYLPHIARKVLYLCSHDYPCRRRSILLILFNIKRLEQQATASVSGTTKFSGPTLKGFVRRRGNQTDAGQLARTL